jgi:hypothetical protein
MAKMFYTLDETKAALGQSEDQIKQLTREGRLREFRDGPRLMFKSDQVDALKSQLGGEMSIADSGAPIGLADSGGGTGSGTALTLADSETEGSAVGSGISSGLAGISGSGLGSGLTGSGGSLSGSGMMNMKEDTALAADLGLSGSVGGMPSPGRTGAGSGTSSGSVGSRQGINVFGDDTHMAADPMAQTAMPGAGSGSVGDLNLEGIGSGSGLLDLTRESDETSLGAELLDEISPSSGGRGRPMAPPDTGSMAGIKLDAPRGGVVRGTTGVREVAAHDAWAGAFGGLALGTGLFLLFGFFALINGVMGFRPDIIKSLGENGNQFFLVFGIGAVVAVLFFAFGKLLAMSSKG